MTRLSISLACALSVAFSSAAVAQFPFLNRATNRAADGSPDMYGMAAQYQRTPPPPPMKLPKGVVKEDGLLFYDGKPYGDVSFRGMVPPGAVQQAGYQSPVPARGEPEGMMMDDGGPSDGPPGAMMPGQMMQGPTMGYGPQQSYTGPPEGMYAGATGGGCCPECGECHDPHHPGCLRWLASLFPCCHDGGRGFPGKLGWNWFATADVVAMTRSIGDNRTLVFRDDGMSLIPALQGEDLDFDLEAGIHVTAGVMGPSGVAYQASYMQLRTFETSETVTGIGDLTIPFPLAAVTVDFSGADIMTVSYDSRIQTAEANMIYPWGSFNLLLGYRWLEVNEFSRIESTDFTSGGTSDFDAFADNQLHGGQIGIMGEWEAWSLLYFDFWAKWGVFGNSASQRQILRDIDNTVLVRDASGSNSEVAFVSEFGAQVVMPLGAIFRLEAGYSIFFINNLALAPSQFDFTDVATSGTQVQFGGDIILHGLNAGVTANW